MSDDEECINIATCRTKRFSLTPALAACKPFTFFLEGFMAFNRRQKQVDQKIQRYNFITRFFFF